MLRPEDFEAIVKTGIGKIGVRVIEREGGWEQFDDMERFALAMHDWYVETTGTRGFDKIAFMEKLNEYNAHIMNATRTVTIGGKGDPSISVLFGDMKIGHPNHALYELFKTKLLYFAMIKANKLMRRDIAAVLRLAKSMQSNEMKQAICDAGIVWMGDDEIDAFIKTYSEVSEEENARIEYEEN